jgi:putative endonuclease
MEEKLYSVYIINNKNNKVLYTGISSNLPKIIYEHKNKIDKKSFVSRYNVSKLVYYELVSDPYSAISREKQIKAGSRENKIQLIEKFNPRWNDLYYDIL